ncbi:putative ATP-dependent DNA helicase Q1 [Acropora muricata]|uniref:putative ATP-dependent DNA helicase Q1 n=1 Tax=Acropora muricata TaxID=159855 RepID=UPI0034E41693
MPLAAASILTADEDTEALVKFTRSAVQPFGVEVDLRVTREQDVLPQMIRKYKNPIFDVTKPLNVEFVGLGENGVDAGGITREYFNLLMQGIKQRSSNGITLLEGYGKSIIFHLLPGLFLHKINSRSRSQTESPIHPVIVVISPLNSLITDQIRRSTEGNVKAAILNVRKAKDSDDLELDNTSETNSSWLKDAKYDIIFTHPEAVLSCKNGIELFQSTPYQRGVQAIVIDEAHCILEWGDDFRKDYANLAMLCATFPTVPVVALTATASKRDVTEIKVSLNLKNPLEIVGNPNQPNIFYKKVFRRGDDVDFFDELLNPIAIGLKEKKVDYPISILYLPLRWCGFSLKFFQKQLGDDQYYSPVNPVERKPENRLFAQYHSPQTRTMKDSILKELSSPSSTVRVVFATVAMGMGVDIPSIRNIIHVGPPRTIKEYIQETGRAGRDGKQSFAVLYYNN